MHTYIGGMPRSASSSAMPDLFDHVPSASAQRSRRLLPKVKPPLQELTGLSDARLARLLGDVAAELKCRRGRAEEPENPRELAQAVQEAVRVLENLMPRQARRVRQPRGADPVSSLQEPKRKAIRAALQAGVAPGQVAKHFGLPLAAVRKVLSQG